MKKHDNICNKFCSFNRNYFVIVIIANKLSNGWYNFIITNIEKSWRHKYNV